MEPKKDKINWTARNCTYCGAIAVAGELYHGGIWQPVCFGHVKQALNEGRLIWLTEPESKPRLEAIQRHLSHLSHGNHCPCAICEGREAMRNGVYAHSD